jgi:hypothetical protein
VSGLALITEDQSGAEDLRGVVVARAAPIGRPSDAQRELILAHLVDPTILDERELFVWSATVSNSNLDSYFTRMHESSLRNYAEDAKVGLAYMNSHHIGGWTGPSELPLGHSFDGRYIGPSGAGPARVDETFYTFRGMAPNGTASLTTDQLIENLRSGIARDISITFMPGSYRCSIDGLDWSSYECRHWPGHTYPRVNAKGEDTGETDLAFLWVHDAHQSEASSVYDGATPGCMVTKAKRLAQAGEIRIETIDWLEQRYRIKLPHPARSFAGADITSPAKEAEPMELTPEQIATVRLALTEAGQPPDADIPTAIRAVVDQHKGIRALEAEVARLKPIADEADRLRPLADEGRQYRADLVTAALTEGKRAYGDTFAEETYRGLLEAAPVETVKRMRDDWATAASEIFKGGRQSQDATEPTPIRQAATPSAAFAG